MPPMAQPYSAEKVGGDHLEFLYGILRDLRRNARASGVFVVEALGGIGAVHQEGVLARDASQGERAVVAVIADDGL